MESITVLGRHSDLKFYWTGSGIEFCTYASTVEIEVEAVYSVNEIYVATYINNKLDERILLLPGMNTITITSDESLKQIKLLKDSQADLENGDHYMRIVSISCPTIKPEAHKKSILFLGDSLTSGEGLVGEKTDMDFIYKYISFDKCYAKITADYFDADYQVISQCGYGIRCGWNNNPDMRVPEVYKYVDGQSIPYDNSFNPDAIVINLGTNDAGAHYQAAFNGYKISGEDFKAAADDFIKQLKTNHPNAFIIWMIGMCDVCLLDEIKEVCDTNEIAFLKVPACPDEDLGSRQHPGPKCHRRSAELLIHELAGKI